MELKTKRITVTGGAGFLGAFVQKELIASGCREIFIPRSRDFDLREKADVTRLYETAKPDVVIHLAARVGGIGANRKYPGEFFYDNAAMGLHLLEQGRRYGIEKFVHVGSICSYPKFASVPFQEDSLWNGYPEETNAPYGLAKKMVLAMGQAYREQYGMDVISVMPVNIYGPGEHFDLENSHVIPALIRKCVEAKEQGKEEIVLWGDGSPTREFLYVADAAKGIVLATSKYGKALPVNLGTGKEVTIKRLAELICELTGFKGKLTWDTSKPNGQPRRCVSTERARDSFGFEASTPLEEGLKETIDWFIKNRPFLEEIPTLSDNKKEPGLNAPKA